ncbi:uncharacterized protein [Lolium perenne]|uniref:uncharacterized protein n=1 Tax=Lolium perenne TaxID=4522 RepID=UPI0021F69162|nr:uncharacterized protein LOC127310430 [Lolium perenne]
MSSGQPSATIVVTSETSPASTAAAHVAPGAEPPPVLSPAELSAAVRDLTMAIANMRTFLQVTHGLPAAVSAPPPPPPPPPAPHATPPPAPAAHQGVPITNIKWPASPYGWTRRSSHLPLPSRPCLHRRRTLRPPPSPPRYTKLEFTTYDGATDPLNYLNQCEQFFRGQRTLASDRTWIASYHLRGAAQTWYYALEQDEGRMPPWERFRDLCLLRFGPPVRGSRLAELGRLQFTSSVQDFADRFQSLACHAPGVSARQRAKLFVGGHPDHIRVDTVDDEDGEPLTPELDTGAVSEPGATTYGPVDAKAFVVSLHALAGIKTAKTMLLPVTISGERLTALVDTGSMHNFLSGDAMRRLALQPSGDEHFSVTVANGDRLACQGVARQVNGS